LGDRRNSQGTLGTDRQFTGQRLDGTGLYYYNARYYDPTIGRFISADFVIPDYSNPQNLNRYSYVANNPLKYTDPSGHVRIDAEYDPGTTSREVKDYWQTAGELVTEYTNPDMNVWEVVDANFDSSNPSGSLETLQGIQNYWDTALDSSDYVIGDNKGGRIVCDLVSLISDAATPLCPLLMVVSIIASSVGLSLTQEDVNHGYGSQEDMDVCITNFIWGNAPFIGFVPDADQLAYDLGYDDWGANMFSS
jgi:RHS repeat-associated protein